MEENEIVKKNTKGKILRINILKRRVIFFVLTSWGNHEECSRQTTMFWKTEKWQTSRKGWKGGNQTFNKLTQRTKTEMQSKLIKYFCRLWECQIQIIKKKNEEEQTSRFLSPPPWKHSTSRLRYQPDVEKYTGP